MFLVRFVSPMCINKRQQAQLGPLQMEAEAPPPKKKNTHVHTHTHTMTSQTASQQATHLGSSHSASQSCNLQANQTASLPDSQWTSQSPRLWLPCHCLTGGAGQAESDRLWSQPDNSGLYEAFSKMACPVARRGGLQVKIKPVPQLGYNHIILFADVHI